MSAQTKIIAHRGAWKEFNLPENSIASLQKAIELKCYGSEFDVRRTKDGVLVVNHDPAYFGDTIQYSNYADLNKNKLSNGESLPLLKNYFKKGTKGKHDTKLICEIKEALSDKEQDYLTTIETLKLADKLNIKDRIIYISFSFQILQWIKEKNPTAIVLYLENNRTIEEISNAKFDGVNYNFKEYFNHPEISNHAISAQLKLGSWTVNTPEDLLKLQQQHIEFITTNQPNQFLQIIK